jgi:hypothetical protein
VPFIWCWVAEPLSPENMTEMAVTRIAKNFYSTTIFVRLRALPLGNSHRNQASHIRS